MLRSGMVNSGFLTPERISSSSLWCWIPTSELSSTDRARAPPSRPPSRSPTSMVSSPSVWATAGIAFFPPPQNPPHTPTMLYSWPLWLVVGWVTPPCRKSNEWQCALFVMTSTRDSSSRLTLTMPAPSRCCWGSSSSASSSCTTKNLKASGHRSKEDHHWDERKKRKQTKTCWSEGSQWEEHGHGGGRRGMCGGLGVVCFRPKKW